MTLASRRRIFATACACELHCAHAFARVRMGVFVCVRACVHVEAALHASLMEMTDECRSSLMALCSGASAKPELPVATITSNI